MDCNRYDPEGITKGFDTINWALALPLAEEHTKNELDWSAHQAHRGFIDLNIYKGRLLSRRSSVHGGMISSIPRHKLRGVIRHSNLTILSRVDRKFASLSSQMISPQLVEDTKFAITALGSPCIFNVNTSNAINVNPNR